MLNNSQYTIIIQYISILGGGLAPPCPPVPTPMYVYHYVIGVLYHV